MSFTPRIPLAASGPEQYEYLYFDPTNAAIYRSTTAPRSALPIGVNAPAADGEWPEGTINKPDRAPEDGDLYTDIAAGAHYVFYNGAWVMLSPQVNSEATIRYDAAGTEGVPVTFVDLDLPEQEQIPIVFSLADVTPAITPENIRGMTWENDSELVIQSAGTYNIKVSLHTFRDYSIFTPDLDDRKPASVALFLNGTETAIKQTLRPQYPGYVVDLFGHLELSEGDKIDVRVDGGLQPRNTVNVDYFALSVNQIDFPNPIENP